jgi:hypothetical protein
VLSKRANPECVNSFDDYQRGWLFRFHQSHPDGGSPVNAHSVKHFWFCSGCSYIYILEYRECRAVLVSRRDRMPTKGAHVPHLWPTIQGGWPKNKTARRPQGLPRRAHLFE